MRYQEVVGATNRILGEYRVRLTVRQTYYRLISPPYQLFANTATNYKSFDKIITKAREREEIDWKRIEDRARTIWGGEKDVFGSPEDYVEWLFPLVRLAGTPYPPDLFWPGHLPVHVAISDELEETLQSE
jgi:hypothetical protein